MKISAGTYLRRAESLADSLVKRRVGAMFLEPGSNFRYLTGLELGRSERLVCAILTAKGALHLVGPAFELDRLRASPAPVEICTWQEHEDPVRLVRDIVLRGSRHTIVAVGPTTRFFVVEWLRVELPGWNFVDAGPFIEEARLRKDAAELAAMREACRMTLAVMKSIPRLLKEGMTELELARRIGGGIVQFGENAAIPHGGPTGRKLGKGDVVLVDTGHAIDGYWSDLTRTFFFGGKTAGFKKVYKVVEEAQKAAIKAIRPGATCQSVDRAARQLIAEAGYGEYFIHRTGHGLGLDIHEPLYLVKGNRAKLRAGMVVTVEPGIYLPGRFGVRIEDDVVVTRTGRSVLSSGR
jgi:Xaa-Pro dipeptidase